MDLSNLLIGQVSSMARLLLSCYVGEIIVVVLRVQIHGGQQGVGSGKSGIGWDLFQIG
jgi:hypothetical protein